MEYKWKKMCIIFITGNIYYQEGFDGIMKLFFKERKNEEAVAFTKRDELKAELDAARDEMAAVYSNLSYVVEQDMIDCCIYQLNALQLRYKIILNQMKDEEARACITVKDTEKGVDIYNI